MGINKKLAALPPEEAAAFRLDEDALNSDEVLFSVILIRHKILLSAPFLVFIWTTVNLFYNICSLSHTSLHRLFLLD